MLISFLDNTGMQIIWIEHLELEEGSLFHKGKRVFRLAEDGTLRQVSVGTTDPADLVDVG